MRGFREARSQLDVVDEDIVRSSYHRAQGDLNAVERELYLATQLAPDSLKGWFYRGALAFEVGDLAGQLEAAMELGRTLRQRARHPEFLGLVQDAKGFAAEAPKLCRKLALFVGRQK